MGLLRMFERSVDLYGDKTALIYESQKINYSALDALSGHYADFLLARGVKQGDNLLILSHNSINCVAVILSCLKTGCVACPVNWRMSPIELAGLLKRQSFVAALCDCQGAALLRSAADLRAIPLNQYRMDEIAKAFGAAVPRQHVREEPGDRIALQLFTSGSTGEPKVIRHSSGGLSEYIYNYALESRWTDDDIYETSANLFHLSGVSILTSLMIGGTAVIFHHFDLKEFLITMKREKCTRVSLVPTLVSRLLNADEPCAQYFTSVKKIVYGGSPMNLATVEQAMEQFGCGLEQAYGTTETGCIAILSGEDHERCSRGMIDRRILFSAGRPLPNVNIRIKEEPEYIEDGMPCCGEIEVNSPFLYAESLIGATCRKCADYHATGDIGYFDEDGYLYLIGRKNDMIISGGENIYPKEVENCISELKQDVAEVCVLGIPDEDWGERVVACIVRKEGSSLTEKQVIEYCKAHIAHYKKPRSVFFMDTLPENANGKIARGKLRKCLYEGMPFCIETPERKC